jgi:hypothetical protein
MKANLGGKMWLKNAPNLCGKVAKKFGKFTIEKCIYTPNFKNV